MKVFCPDCGALIPADDLNLQTLLARCHACNNVFSFADVSRQELSRGGRVAALDTVAAPCPPRFHIDETPTAWVAAWRWFSPVAFFLIFFCIAWDGFLIFWYTMALTHRGPWIMVLFPICHVAIGVSLTYFTIATFINSTHVTARRGELSIHSGPLPWFGNRSLPSASVKQIFSRAVNSSNRSNGFNNAGGNATFAVHAVLDDGRTVRLVGGLKGPDEANFLQQQLEKRLNVRPSPLLPQV